MAMAEHPGSNLRSSKGGASHAVGCEGVFSHAT